MSIADTALIFLTAAGGLSDAHKGLIPNALTYPAWIFGWSLALMAGGWHGLSLSLLGFAVGFLPFFLLYLTGSMGGGDVKLMAAVGALMGYPFVLNALMTSIFIGGALGLLMMIWEGKAWATFRWLGMTVLRAFYPALEQELLETRRQLPFGVAICLGSILTLMSEWFGHASPASFLDSLGPW